MAGSMTRFTVLLVLFAFASFAYAQTFYDPMQPPAFALNKMRLEKAKARPSPPVKSTVKAEQKEPQWELNSILYSKQRQHAIINNTLVRPGGSIDGAKLVRLEPDTARLLVKNKVVVLKLPGRHQKIKQSVKR